MSWRRLDPRCTSETMITVKRRAGGLASAFLFLAACTSSEAQKAPDLKRPVDAPKTASTDKPSAAAAGRIRDVWYEFEFSGQKIGFIRSIDERTQVDGRLAYHLNRSSMLSVKRQAQTVEISSTIDSWFALDGTPIRFVHRRTEGAENRTVEGEREGNEFVVRMAVGKNSTEKRFPMTQDLRLSSSIEVLLADRLKVGAMMEGKVIDETHGDVVPFTSEVASVDKDGLFLVRQQVGPIRADVKLDADGTVVHVALPEMGVTQRRSTRAEAVKAAEAFDLFSAALFRMPRPLPDRGEIEELTLQLSSARGATVKVISDDRQTAKPKGKAARLTIRRQAPPKTARTRPLSDESRAPFLKGTDYEPLDDEALRATADRLTKGKTTVWDGARAINAFVYEHIENKSLARAYASAPEALASREGDCTEHAVLFSALAKIAGIPTRLVTGLVYVGGPNNVFGYHEWVEIWTGETWLAMDPTFGQDIADATHIKLYAGMSNPEGLRASGQVAAGAIGDLEIELVDYVDGSGRRRSL